MNVWLEVLDIVPAFLFLQTFAWSLTGSSGLLCSVIRGNLGILVPLLSLLLNSIGGIDVVKTVFRIGGLGFRLSWFGIDIKLLGREGKAQSWTFLSGFRGHDE